MNPNIKILILNWNGIDVIHDCLKSIESLLYDNYSVTVIDNNSDDLSIDYIKNNFNNIDILELPENYGYSKGYNMAFDYFLNDTGIDYYLLLNNDTIVNDVNMLNILINSSLKFGDNNIYSPIILNSKNKIWYAGGIVNKLFGYTKHIGINKSSNYSKYKTQRTDYVTGCSMFIKKDLMIRLNGFNELFIMYYEDVDLCLRAKKNNSYCYIIDKTTIIHNFSHSFKGFFKFKKMYLKFNSMIKFIFINNFFLLSLLVLFFHLFMIPFYFILYFIRLAIRI